jgi:hypothetical protein
MIHEEMEKLKEEVRLARRKDSDNIYVPGFWHYDYNQDKEKVFVWLRSPIMKLKDDELSKEEKVITAERRLKDWRELCEIKGKEVANHLRRNIIT